MKKSFIAALALSVSLSFAAGAAAAAEQTLAQKHQGMWPKSENGFVTKNQCLKCHVSYEDLAKKTANLEPNPHDNHMGKVNCEDCHKANQAKPELMCNSCHNFTLKEKAAKKYSFFTSFEKTAPVRFDFERRRSFLSLFWPLSFV